MTASANDNITRGDNIVDGVGEETAANGGKVGAGKRLGKILFDDPQKEGLTTVGEGDVRHSGIGDTISPNSQGKISSLHIPGTTDNKEADRLGRCEAHGKVVPVEADFIHAKVVVSAGVLKISLTIISNVPPNPSSMWSAIKVAALSMVQIDRS